MGKKGGGTTQTSSNPAWLDKAGQELYDFAKNVIFQPNPATSFTPAGTTVTATPPAGKPGTIIPGSWLSKGGVQYYPNAPADTSGAAASAPGPMSLENLRPLEQYQGQRVADMPGEFTQAANLASMMANNIGGYFPKARENVESATKGYGQVFSNNNIATGIFDSAAADQYMNPFIKSVVEQNLAQVRRDADIERKRIGANQVASSAFGGSRHALQEAELARNVGEQVSKTTNQGYSDAFTQALNAFMQDQARKLTADTFNEEMRFKGHESNRSQFNTERDRNMAAAQTLGNLATAKSNILSQDVERLMRTGSAKQDHAQRLADVDYSDFLEKREYPYTQMERLAGIVGGSPSRGTITTTKEPSGLAQALGAGLSLASFAMGAPAFASAIPGGGTVGGSLINGMPWR